MTATCIRTLVSISNLDYLSVKAKLGCFVLALYRANDIGSL